MRGSPSPRAGLIALPLWLVGAVLLAGCIPERVLDRDWCRSMDAARSDADGKARRNLVAAMKKHNCEAKLQAVTP